jgi:hypothetical protein
LPPQHKPNKQEAGSKQSSLAAFYERLLLDYVLEADSTSIIKKIITMATF